LRILKGGHGQARPSLEIEEFDDRSGGSPVDSQSADTAAILVNALAVVKNGAIVAGDKGINLGFGDGRAGKDVWPTAKRGEFNLGGTSVYDRLTCQPISVAKEGFGLGAGAQTVHATADIDDALMACALTIAGGWNANPELIRAVE
jgi:hypothetical protein